MWKWTARIISSLMALVMVEAATHCQSNDPRQLRQPTLNYRANYTAEFQHWRGVNCMGDVPILQVSCYDEGMTVPNTSDTAIVCTKLQQPQVPYGTTYECQNTCNETATSACTDIYLAETFDANLFGSIRFLCKSDDVREVEASIVYWAGNNNGTCTASGSDPGFNLHVSRLGISCPVRSSREYVYNDFYFECPDPGSFSFDFALAKAPDIYYRCCARVGVVMLVALDDFRISLQYHHIDWWK
jgi:hypothetical protein